VIGVRTRDGKIIEDN